MRKKSWKQFLCINIIAITVTISGCKVPQVVQRSERKATPAGFSDTPDSVNSAKIKWQEFFTDPYLLALIDTALKNNQELNILSQEINIARMEVKARKGEYLPFVTVGGAAGVEKVSRYTSQGASDANAEVEPGKPIPDPLPDFFGGAMASWEVDIWRKLRNARQAAYERYMASVEGKNFVTTQLIAEIANSYYELLALDNQLDILKKNIQIQTEALETVRLQKQAAKVTELAVRRFEAEVLKNQSRQYEIQQQIIEIENRINFLVGRFPTPIPRNWKDFPNMSPVDMQEGIPSQLLENRPDIRQAELELEASKLDVKVAKADFYPSFRITAGIGLQAFNPAYLAKMPESLLLGLAGDLVGPLINKNAIKANYISANARQLQAVYNYERSILTGYIEVANQVAKIDNLGQSYALRSRQVETLSQSIAISTSLFQSARADYMEVLLTQRDALESKMELIETKKQQMNAWVDMYRALGGGWN